MRWSEQRFLMNHHNMPVAFILNVVVIYDNKKLIADLKGFIREAIERRKALKYVLIDELKARIETQLQIEPISCFDAKRKSCNIIVSIRPTTGIKPLYTTIATVTMNLIVSAAIVLLNPYVTIYISYKIPPFALSVHIPDVSTSIYVEVDSKVLLGLPFCDKAFVR